jgi:hypothetical protein
VSDGLVSYDAEGCLGTFSSTIIGTLGKELGFSTSEIRTRAFRAEKSGMHIVRIITE